MNFDIRYVSNLDYSMLFKTREDKGDREGISHTHPIP